MHTLAHTSLTSIFPTLEVPSPQVHLALGSYTPACWFLGTLLKVSPHLPVAQIQDLPPVAALLLAPHSHPFLGISGSHLTAISELLDVRAGLRAQLILVGPSEFQGTILGHSRARVGDILVGRDAEQPQEGELDHAHWGALGVHIGELERRDRVTMTVLGSSHGRGKDQ